MIAEIDPNHDNKISFEEFCEMFDNAGLEKKFTENDGLPTWILFYIIIRHNFYIYIFELINNYVGVNLKIEL